MSKDDLKRDLLAFACPSPIKVAVRGKTFFVRVMTAFDAVQLQKALAKNKVDDGRESGRLLTMVLCDEGGGLLYDIENPEEVDQLSKLPPDIPRLLLAASSEANGPPEGN